MNLQYKILCFHSEIGSIEVNYFCDEFPEGLTYNIDLLIVENKYPTLEEIYGLILQYQPTGQLQRLLDLKNAVVPDYLAKLKYIPPMSIEINTDQPIVFGVDQLPK
jgi:hypothetical protein